MTFYRNIIKDSWLFTMRFKYLWFFGLFALLLGNGGEYEIFARSMFGNNNSESIWAIYFQPMLNMGVLSNIGTRFWESPFLTSAILATYLFVIVVFLFIAWMMNVSQIAIVNSVSKETRGKEHDIKIGMQKGILNFWPVFALNVSVKVLTFALIALIGYLSGSVFVIALFLIFIPLLMSLSFVTKYTIGYIIIRKEKFLEALTSAWSLFRKNWIISLELALILYLFTTLAAIVFLFLDFNITKLFEVLATAFPVISFDLIFTILPITLLFVLAFVLSVFSVFQISAWTKLFLELDSKGGKSKIERLFSK